MSKSPKSTTTTPDTQETAWLAKAQEDAQKAPERLEDAAKFLVGVVSITLTIFITKRPEGLAEWTGSWFMWATYLWLGSLVLCFFVFFPWRYSFTVDDPTSVQQAYGRIVRNKRVLLVLSLVCFGLALGMASCAFMCG